MPERMIASVVIVSGLAALGALLLGAGRGAIATTAGVLAAALALFGIVVLARAVVVIERERGRR